MAPCGWPEGWSSWRAEPTMCGAAARRGRHKRAGRPWHLCSLLCHVEGPPWSPPDREAGRVRHRQEWAGEFSSSQPSGATAAWTGVSCRQRRPRRGRDCPKTTQQPVGSHAVQNRERLAVYPPPSFKSSRNTRFVFQRDAPRKGCGSISGPGAWRAQAFHCAGLSRAGRSEAVLCDSTGPEPVPVWQVASPQINT